MKHFLASEKILIEEVMQAAEKMGGLTRGLAIGGLIKLIRTQLGMSQKILAKRAGVPQSTIARIEKGARDPNLLSLRKVLSAMSCDLLLVPMLQAPIDTIRRRQAKKMAEKRIGYLKGTMSLEEQRPDSRMINELLAQEENRLLHKSTTELWEE